jgi:hypothetical protein
MSARERRPRERDLLERAILLGPEDLRGAIAQIPFTRVVEFIEPFGIALRLECSAEAPTLGGGSGPISTVYCRDRDGVPMEVIVFAGDDGRLAWLEVFRWDLRPVQRFPTAQRVTDEYPVEDP